MDDQFKFLGQDEIARELKKHRSLKHEQAYWLAFSQVLNTRRTFTSDTIREMLEGRIEPYSPSWWGGMFRWMLNRALSAGLIVKMKHPVVSKRPVAHGRKLAQYKVLR
jgi:hypothetical protein